MDRSLIPRRILIAGYDVGGLARILKTKYPNVLIGAVDVLGNLETRFYADWKFSIVKQSPGLPFTFPKHRTTLELLYELTNVMLEDLEFDLLILLSPFNQNPYFIKHLSRRIKVNVSNLNSLSKISSAYSFLTEINFLISEKNNLTLNRIKFSEISNSDLPAFFISKDGIKFFSTRSVLDTRNFENKFGYLLKFSQLYCAFFLKKSNEISFLGIQTIEAPYEHKIFDNVLEKNALIPFSHDNKNLYDRCKSLFIEIIDLLELTDSITFYFGLKDNYIFPIVCSTIPDENFLLWQLRSSEILMSRYLIKDSKLNSPLTAQNFAFKLPIYSYKSIKVPKIPQEIADSRNNTGIISHPDYPLCTLWGASFSIKRLKSMMNQKTLAVKKILFSRY